MTWNGSDWNGQDESTEFWHSGKLTRRRLVGWGAGTLGGNPASACAVASRLWSGQTLQDRHHTAAFGRWGCRRQGRARRRADGRGPHQ
jgi:hypothetical protein